MYVSRMVDKRCSRLAVLLALVGALTLNSLAQDIGKQPGTLLSSGANIADEAGKARELTTSAGRRTTWC